MKTFLWVGFLNWKNKYWWFFFLSITCIATYHLYSPHEAQSLSSIIRLPSSGQTRKRCLFPMMHFVRSFPIIPGCELSAPVKMADRPGKLACPLLTTFYIFVCYVFVWYSAVVFLHMEWVSPSDRPADEAAKGFRPVGGLPQFCQSCQGLYVSLPV